MGMLSYTSSVCVSFSLCLAFSDTIFFLCREETMQTHTHVQSDTSPGVRRLQQASQIISTSLGPPTCGWKVFPLWPVDCLWFLPAHLSICLPVFCVVSFFCFSWRYLVCIRVGLPISFISCLFVSSCLSELAGMSLSLRSLYRWLEERICFTQYPLLQSAATYVTSFSIWTRDIWSDSNCWPRSSFLSSVGDMTLRLVGQTPFMQFGWFLQSCQEDSVALPELSGNATLVAV